MESSDIIEHLDGEGILNTWVEKSKSQSIDDLGSDLYNYFLEENDPRDFDIFHQITYSIFINGLRSIDWDDVCGQIKLMGENNGNK